MLSLVIILVDFVNKNEEYIVNKISYADVFSYYAAFIPFIVNFLTPITIFITAVFVTSKLSQRSEIIACLSSGISFSRFISPYIVGSTIIACLSFTLTGWILPKSNIKKNNFENRLGYAMSNTTSKYIHIRISPQCYLYMESYYPSSKVGFNATLETIINNKLMEKLYAKKVEWLEDKQIWQLKDWSSRKITGLNETISYGEFLDKELYIKPTDLRINPKLYETLTLPELNSQINALKSRESENVRIFLTEKYVRYMAPFVAIILTFIGVVVSARKIRGGTGLQISLGFGLAFVYIAMFLFARGVAEAKGVNLLFTLWTPNILFSIVGFVLYKMNFK